MAERAGEQALRRLFDEAMSLPEAERDGFVAAVDDELLRERLAALVSQDRNPTVRALRRQNPEGLRQLGEYELLRILGKGGMGVVFLGVQMEPVERLVAVKLITDIGHDEELDQRFRAEQRALMRMNHPGIARILDVGNTDDGSPFLVMEYVRGEPLMEFCDRRRLDLATRIRLLADLCDAVQHAHQKGVIHRDLKPSNILVTETEGRVQPKLIDFGLARATAGRLAHMQPTAPGVVLGTLQYMSPEQAGSGQDIDTRTDVYSLGALLHELLTGAPPLPLGDDEGAVVRFVADLEAGRLRGAAATTRALDAEELAQRADDRSTTPLRWQRELETDLGAIVQKALAVDRTRRYATASELGADLRRHLRGEPVSARAPTVRYLVARFVQRHRAGVLAGAVAALLVLGSGAAAFWGMLSAQRAHAAEQLLRARLQEAAARIEAVRDFSTFVQLYGDPGLRGEAPSLRQSLHAATPMIAVRWKGRPQLESAVRRALGRALLALGEPVAATRELQAAWRMLEALPDVDPAWATEVLADLSRAERQANDLDASRLHLAHLLELGASAAREAGPKVAARLLATAKAVTGADAARAVLELQAAMTELGALDRDGTAFRAAAAALFAAVVQLFQDGADGSDVLLSQIEVVVRDLRGDEVEFASILARLAEMRLRVGQYQEVVALAGELLSKSARLGLNEHWLVAQAERQRGLALALGADAARGEADLQALHRRLVRYRSSGNEQVVAAIGATRELCTCLARDGRLRAFLVASWARWQARADDEPWWPVADDGCADAGALALVLELAGARADDGRSAAVAGAALLHLGRIPEACERLDAAVRGQPQPSPELLADHVIALHRADRRDQAAAAAARLRRAAEGREDARWRRALARVDAVQ